MDASYNQILESAKTKQDLEKYFKNRDQLFPLQNEYPSKDFLELYIKLKETFCVCFILCGEVNFKAICYKYFMSKPSRSKEELFSFSDFIKNYPELTYLYWFSKIDWLLAEKNLSNHIFECPKGTLESWANIYKDEESLDIKIDFSQLEKIQLQKIGNEFSIKAL